MWSSGGGGGIADNLSREFRSMSTARDRRYASERGVGYSSSGDVSPFATTGSSRATSPPLRYGSHERARYGGYEAIRRYSRDGSDRAGYGGGGAAYAAGSRTRGVEGWKSRDHAGPSPNRHTRPTRAGPAVAVSSDYRGGGRARSSAAQYCRSSRRDEPSDSSASSYSYSYSYSGSGSESEDSSYSDDSAYRQQRGGARGRARRGNGQRGAPPPPTSQPRGSRAVRYTPTGPGGAVSVGEQDGPVHWVGDEDAAAQQQQRRPPTSAGFNGMLQQQQQRPVMSAQMPELQPSGLLLRVIEAVAYYRGVAMPPSIPSEVTLAFDEYVSRGSTMLKFLSHGHPHARYFIIRFLDVVPGKHSQRGRGSGVHEAAAPHAVLSWYRNTSSRHMIRFLPLHDLLEVKADGSDHPYVQRRTVQPGMLRGPRSGFSTNYVYADHILQFRFRSRLSRGEETLALKAANRTQHLAWLVVGTFISQVGGGGERPIH